MIAPQAHGPSGPDHRPSTARRGRRVALLALPVMAALVACLPTGPGTEIISVSAQGSQLPGMSSQPVISADARYVVFASDSTALDPEGRQQIYRKDRVSGAVVLVSRGVDGSPLHYSHNPSVSADGTQVAFETHLPALDHDVVLVRDVTSATTERVSVGRGGDHVEAGDPDISSDGRHVSFVSDSSELVPGDTNGTDDVFVLERTSRTIRRVSLSFGGFQIAQGADAGAISGNGRYVAFRTQANLTGADTDSDADIYVRDTVTGATTYDTIAGPGTRAVGLFGLSDDGRRLAFASGIGTSPWQAWVRDRQTGELTLISRAHGTTEPTTGDIFNVVISRDGTHVAFSSGATDLVTDEGPHGVFVSTTAGGALTRMSVTDAGAASNGQSFSPQVADGGTTVAFASVAGNLVPTDTTPDRDVFVRRR